MLLVKENVKLGTHSCGSVIVNENWILTSAHCVQVHPNKRRLAFGHDQDLVKMFNAGRLEIESIHRNDQFRDNQTGLFYDLALVKLVTPLPLKAENVAPACLNFGPTPKNVVFTMFGWGSAIPSRFVQPPGYWSHEQPSRYLRELNLFETSQDKMCKNRNDIMCVVTYGDENKNHAACRGDEGSPVHTNRNGKKRISKLLFV